MSRETPSVGPAVKVRRTKLAGGHMLLRWGFFARRFMERISLKRMVKTKTRS